MELHSLIIKIKLSADLPPELLVLKKPTIEYRLIVDFI